MKNYFETGRVHLYSDNLSKSILLQNNYEHTRFMSMAPIGASGGAQQIPLTKEQEIYLKDKGEKQGKQSKTDGQSFILDNSDPRQTLEMLKEMSGNNPNMKLSAEAFRDIASGKRISVQMEQYAPERRNLFVGLFAAAAQLAGGLAGAAHNDELGKAVTGRAKGDAEFVKEHGNSFSLNIFGGAEVRGGQIKVNTIDDPSQPQNNNTNVTNNVVDQILQQSFEKALENLKKAEQRGNIGSQGIGVGSISGGDQYGGQFTVARHEEGTGALESGDNAQVRERFAEQFLSQYGSANQAGTNNINYVAVNEANLNNPDAKRAVQDYLTLAASTGVLKGVTAEQIQGMSARELVGKFDQLERQLGLSTGLIDDNKLGAQHLTALQQAVIGQAQGLGAATQGIALLSNAKNAINTVNAGGQVSEAQQQTLLDAYNQANGTALTKNDFNTLINELQTNPQGIAALLSPDQKNLTKTGGVDLNQIAHALHSGNTGAATDALAQINSQFGQINNALNTVAGGTFKQHAQLNELSTEIGQITQDIGKLSAFTSALTNGNFVANLGQGAGNTASPEVNQAANKFANLQNTANAVVGLLNGKGNELSAGQQAAVVKAYETATGENKSFDQIQQEVSSGNLANISKISDNLTASFTGLAGTVNAFAAGPEADALKQQVAGLGTQLGDLTAAVSQRIQGTAGDSNKSIAERSESVTAAVKGFGENSVLTDTAKTNLDATIADLAGGLNTQLKANGIITDNLSKGQLELLGKALKEGKPDALAGNDPLEAAFSKLSDPNANSNIKGAVDNLKAFSEASSTVSGFLASQKDGGQTVSDKVKSNIATINQDVKDIKAAINLAGNVNSVTGLDKAQGNLTTSLDNTRTSLVSNAVSTAQDAFIAQVKGANIETKGLIDPQGKINEGAIKDPLFLSLAKELNALQSQLVEGGETNKGAINTGALESFLKKAGVSDEKAAVITGNAENFNKAKGEVDGLNTLVASLKKGETVSQNAQKVSEAKTETAPVTPSPTPVDKPAENPVVAQIMEAGTDEAKQTEALNAFKGLDTDKASEVLTALAGQKDGAAISIGLLEKIDPGKMNEIFDNLAKTPEGAKTIAGIMGILTDEKTKEIFNSFDTKGQENVISAMAGETGGAAKAATLLGSLSEKPVELLTNMAKTPEGAKTAGSILNAASTDNAKGLLSGLDDKTQAAVFSNMNDFQAAAVVSSDPAGSANLINNLASTPDGAKRAAEILSNVDTETAKNVLGAADTGKAASILSKMPSVESKDIVAALGDKAGAILDKMDVGDVKDIVSKLGNTEAAAAVAGMDTQKAANTLSGMSTDKAAGVLSAVAGLKPEKAGELLNKMDPQKAAEVKSLMSTKPETIQPSPTPTTPALQDPLAIKLTSEPPEKQKDNLKQLAAKDPAEGAKIIGSIAAADPKKAADILSQLPKDKATEFLAKIDPQFAAAIITADPEKGKGLINNLAAKDSGAAAKIINSIAETAGSQKAAKLVSDMGNTEAAAVLAGMNPQKAAAVIANLDNSQGANILSAMAKSNPEKASGIVAAVAESSGSQKAADLLTAVATKQGGEKTAGDILGNVGSKAAAGIIDKMGNQEAAAVVGNLSSQKAAEVLQNLSTEKAGGIVAHVDGAKAADILSKLPDQQQAQAIKAASGPSASDNLTQGASGPGEAIRATRPADGLPQQSEKPEESSKAKEKLHAVFQSIADILNQSNITAQLLIIADTLLAKAYKDENYRYGFNTDVGITASSYNVKDQNLIHQAQNGEGPLASTYTSAREAGAGIVKGINDIGIFKANREADAFMKNKGLEMSVEEAMAKLNKGETGEKKKPEEIIQGVIDNAVKNGNTASGVTAAANDILALGGPAASYAISEIAKKDNVLAAGILAQMNQNNAGATGMIVEDLNSKDPKMTSGLVSAMHKDDVKDLLSNNNVSSETSAGIISGMGDKNKALDVINNLDTKKATEIVSKMAPAAAADMLGKMEPQKAATLINAMDTNKAAEVLGEMSVKAGGADKAADILNNTSGDKKIDILSKIAFNDAQGNNNSQNANNIINSGKFGQETTGLKNKVEGIGQAANEVIASAKTTGGNETGQQPTKLDPITNPESKVNKLSEDDRVKVFGIVANQNIDLGAKMLQNDSGMAQKANSDDIAHVVNNVDADKGKAIISQLDDQKKAEVIAKVEADKAKQIMEKLGVDSGAKVIEELMKKGNGAAAGELLKNLDQQQAGKIMEKVDPNVAAKLLSDKSVSVNTAANIMANMDTKAAEKVMSSTDMEKVKGQDIKAAVEKIDKPSAPDKTPVVDNPVKDQENVTTGQVLESTQDPGKQPDVDTEKRKQDVTDLTKPQQNDNAKQVEQMQQLTSTVAGK